MIRVRFEGGEELARNLRRLSTRLSKRILREALMEAGEPMRASTARKAPREPGAPDLAEHINIAPRRDVDGSAAVGIGVPKRFFYDLFQEFGTVNHDAQAFYRPAFDEEVPKALGVLGAALWRELAARGISRTVDSPSSPGGGLI